MAWIPRDDASLTFSSRSSTKSTSSGLSSSRLSRFSKAYRCLLVKPVR
jgi:hypothetical protein